TDLFFPILPYPWNPWNSWPVLFACEWHCLFRRQARADDFVVVSGEDAFVGEGWVGPADAATVGELAGGRLDELGAADFVIAVGREAGDDEFAPLVEQKHPIAIADEMDGGPAGAG